MEHFSFTCICTIIRISLFFKQLKANIRKLIFKWSMIKRKYDFRLKETKNCEGNCEKRLWFFIFLFIIVEFITSTLKCTSFPKYKSFKFVSYFYSFFFIITFMLFGHNRCVLLQLSSYFFLNLNCALYLCMCV